jgi:urease accessory protein
MQMVDPASPCPKPREREGPSPQGSEGEGSSSPPGLHSPASLREAPLPASRDKESCAGLYRLLVWLSPGFPIGSFSFSHGLETAAEGGVVRDRTSLQAWIGAVIASGSGRIDADILRDAHRAASSDDVSALTDANLRGAAFRGTAETRLETAAQGEAFLSACRTAWPEPFLDRWAASVGQGSEAVCYPAAVGVATARAGIPLAYAVTGYLQAMAANLTSASLRLGIIGQTDGQRILAALEPVIGAAAVNSLNRGPCCFGGATFAVELASMAHETQYTRLFRS